jgi:hypothetical protein
MMAASFETITAVRFQIFRKTFLEYAVDVSCFIEQDINKELRDPFRK